MKAVVMAGGEGSRLRPLTIGRPKPMVPIVDVPVIEHIFGLLRRHGITEVVVTLQYLARVIQDYFGDGADFGMQIHYSVEETPLGTAGSVKNAEDVLGRPGEPFIVISGDALTDFDLDQIVQHHQRKAAMATLTLYRVPNPLEYGVVIIDSETRVERFLEKPSWGEVFSDTVNTGIYVLDPAIFQYVPAGVPVDWSNDVFPKLLANGDPMFGYVAGGYWCDVGNLAEYSRANADMLHGLCNLEMPGHELPGRIWVCSPTKEGDAEISPTAKLYGPVFLGKGVEIRANAVVHGPAVIGDYTIVEERAKIDRSIIWQNSYIGEGADLQGAIIGKQTSLKTGSAIFEGAVIGDNCTVGEGAIIRPNIKLWPNKEVEPGATVSASIIWGSQGRRSIFSPSGVSGLANIEMVPEFAARLGAALGSLYPKGSRITTNRDLSPSARMIKRGLISGLLSAGIDVLDIQEVPVPVARYETRVSDAVAGAHVRVSPDNPGVIDVKLFDAHGLNIDKNTERKIETTFFREDFRRVSVNDIGRLDILRGVDIARGPVVERYSDAFLQHCVADNIRKARGRSVVDYGLGSTSMILPNLLGALGAETITVNAATSATHSLRTPAQHEQDLRQLAAVCRAIGASFGAMMDNDGKTLSLVDDRGTIVSSVSALLAFAVLTWRSRPGSLVLMPLTAPATAEQLARDNNGHVLRVPANPQAQMRAAELHGPSGPGKGRRGAPDAAAQLVGDGEGSYILPDFHPGFDAMMAVARLLEYLGQLDVRLSDVLAEIPPFFLAA
ncbi:MAG TPA: sugar phosphate nucleotidyltransferase, partial [Chloroflexota bacterium]|nr:sugar phosphate nucleotidyltransferase [Chloroflexota bacterium]